MATTPQKAKAVKSGKLIDVWKRKRWYKLVAPRLFNEQVLGESPSAEPEAIVGRTIAVNMMNLVRDIKRQNFNVVFQVEKVQGEMAYCVVKNIAMIPSTIRRMIRAGKKRIDDSFIVATKDKVPVRLKPLMVTTGMANHSVETALRKRAEEFSKSVAAQMSYEDLLGNVAYGKFQREMREAVQKIYPLKICEIRMLQREKGTLEPQQIAPQAPAQQVPVEEEAVEEAVGEAAVQEQQIAA